MKKYLSIPILLVCFGCVIIYWQYSKIEDLNYAINIALKQIANSSKPHKALVVDSCLMKLKHNIDSVFKAGGGIVPMPPCAENHVFVIN